MWADSDILTFIIVYLSELCIVEWRGARYAFTWAGVDTGTRNKARRTTD